MKNNVCMKKIEKHQPNMTGLHEERDRDGEFIKVDVDFLLSGKRSICDDDAMVAYSGVGRWCPEKGGDGINQSS
jgi:hypothetical protein